MVLEILLGIGSKNKSHTIYSVYIIIQTLYMVLKSNLTGKELTRQDINNLFDTFGYFIKIYKGLVKATETEIIQNLISDKEENCFKFTTWQIRKIIV